MNAGAVMGEKSALDAFVGRRQGNVRQVEPDDEVAAQAHDLLDRRAGISPLLQGIQELRHEASSGLDLRRHSGLPGLDQMPEEPDRMQPALLSGLPAGPTSDRATAFMAQETSEDADVERVETLPFE